LLTKVSIDRILYVNFESSDLQNLDSRDLVNMIETFLSLYTHNKKIWLFLDEIQNVEKWEDFVRTEIDKGKIQVFLSGSSSKMLSKEIATSMRGRNLTYSILPFSFSEYLNNEKLPIKNLSSSEKNLIINKLETYLNEGGYPEVILFPQEKDKILNDILETTIYKDIVDRYKIRNTKLLKLLIKSLISSSVREFSVHKFYNFAKSMGMKVSKNTVYSYMDALEDVFFLFQVRKFAPSYKEIEQSLPKIYVVDNGLLTSNGINDKGRLIENLVFIELKRRGGDVYYYKSTDEKEVDFVLLKNKKPTQLIQVCFSIHDFMTKEREVNSLIKASNHLKCNNLLIITYDYDGKEKIEGKNIVYISLWKWLLSKSSP